MGRGRAAVKAGRSGKTIRRGARINRSFSKRG
jgi:hypothetical protein